MYSLAYILPTIIGDIRVNLSDIKLFYPNLYFKLYLTKYI